MTDQISPRRYQALDSLRGVCACMVALMHFSTTGYVSSSRLIQNSFLLVDFFFVLSGFVIAASYAGKLKSGYPASHFIFLRLGRLYPLHLAMLLAFFAFEVILLCVPAAANRQPFSAEYSVSAFIASLFLAQIFYGSDKMYWNSPSWSISAEVWTYILFAFVMRSKRHMLIVALTPLLAFLYLYGWAGDRYLNDVHDFALARCLLSFSLGIIAFEARSRLALPGKYGMLEPMTLLLLGIAISLAKGPWEFGIPILFAWSIYLFSFETGPVSRLLSTPPLLLLGTLSYSIYLTHWFIVLRLDNVLARIDPALINSRNGSFFVGTSPLVGDLMSLAFLSLVIGCSWATYRLIESPSRRWSRKFVAARSGANQAAISDLGTLGETPVAFDPNPIPAATSD